MGIQYNIHQDKKNECLFQMIEEWESQTDLDAHLKAAHLKPLFGDKFKKIAKVTASFCRSPQFELSRLSLIGKKVPNSDIFIYADGPSKTSTDKLFNGKNVIVFAIPGAFTPTCQHKHAPTYVQLYDELKKNGIDSVYCLAVNDPFTLNAFNKSIGGEGKIDIISDFDASFVKKLGKTIDASAVGLGIRASRFSFYAQNGVIQQYFEEPDPGKMTNTDAQTILDAINICASCQ